MEYLKTKDFNLATNIYGDSKSSKLAFVLPGRGDTKDYDEYAAHSLKFSELGFYTICFDPPGIWESDGRISIYNISNYVKAVGQIIELLGNRETHIFGHSMGSLVALICASQFKQVKQIIVSAVSYSFQEKYKKAKQAGLYDMWMEEGRQFTRIDPKNPNTRSYNLPATYFTDAEQYNMLEYLKRSQINKTFIKLTKDSEDKNRMIDEAFEESRGPKSLFEVEAEHNYRDNQKAISEINRIIESSEDNE